MDKITLDTEIDSWKGAVVHRLSWPLLGAVLIVAIFATVMLHSTLTEGQAGVDHARDCTRKIATLAAQGEELLSHHTWPYCLIEVKGDEGIAASFEPWPEEEG